MGWSAAGCRAWAPPYARRSNQIKSITHDYSLTPRTQVIPLDERSGLGEAFNMRLDELKVVDITFLCETVLLLLHSFFVGALI